MERRKFLATAALGITGFTLFPLDPLLGSFGSTIRVIDLPGTRNHIRHGNLDTNPPSQTSLPHWLGDYQLDRFYENGISPGTNDLFHLSLTVSGKQISLLMQNDDLWVGTAKGMKQYSFGFSSHHLVHTENNFKIEILRPVRQKFRMTPTEAQTFLGVLTGSARLNGHLLNASRGALLNKISGPLEANTSNAATMIKIELLRS